MLSYQVLLQLSGSSTSMTRTWWSVSPDTGAVARNKFYAEALHKPLAILYKERDYSKVSTNAKNSNISSIRLLGDVKDKIVLMADDMIGTGGTLLIAMRELKALGAKKIICAISLPFFNGNAIDTFNKAYEDGDFFRIIGTNAVYHDERLANMPWFIYTDVSDLFARIISRLHHGRTLSPLLDNRMFITRLINGD